MPTMLSYSGTNSSLIKSKPKAALGNLVRDASFNGVAMAKVRVKLLSLWWTRMERVAVRVTVVESGARRLLGTCIVIIDHAKLCHNLRFSRNAPFQWTCLVYRSQKHIPEVSKRSCTKRYLHPQRAKYGTLVAHSIWMIE